MKNCRSCELEDLDNILSIGDTLHNGQLVEITRLEEWI